MRGGSFALVVKPETPGSNGDNTTSKICEDRDRVSMPVRQCMYISEHGL